MRRDELSPSQLEERETVVQRLTGAGWNTTSINILFDRGEEVPLEASMEYENNGISLAVECELSSGTIYFEIFDEATERGLNLAIRYGDRLEALLEKITSFQDQITADNFRDYVRQIVRLIPETYLIVDDEYVPVIDD